MPYTTTRKQKIGLKVELYHGIPFDRQMLVAKALGVPANRIVVRTKRMGELLLNIITIIL